jgi:hypothetical protein
MRGVYIIAEGQTEEEFIKTTLAPYLYSNGVNDVRAILMETSPGYRGGDVKYSRYKSNITRFLKHEADIIVTSLIDFYKLEKDFPKYEEASQIQNIIEKVSFLENSISQDILNNRFIPYIQLHEFEGLLFSNRKGFDYLPDVSQQSLEELDKTIEVNPNPELINDGAKSAPSKRLIRLIPNYRKRLYGATMALEIGMPTLLEKCPRFSNWVSRIIQKVNDPYS